MESFTQLMSCIGASQSGSDFVANLPVEIAELILLKLDPRCVLNAALVSRKWLAVCKGSSRLRRITRCHLRKNKKRMMSHRPIVTRHSSHSISLRKPLGMPSQGTIAPSMRLEIRTIRINKPDSLKNRSNLKEPSNPVNPSNIPTGSSLRLR